MFINHNFEIWHKNAYRLSCYVNTERTTKKLIISRWGFFLFFSVGTRGVSKLHKSEICAGSQFFASYGCPPPSWKRKNEEEKHRMEVGYRELGLGGGGRWKSYCPPVHYKNQLRVFAFLCGFLMLWIGGGKNLMFIIILMKINTYSM